MGKIRKGREQREEVRIINQSWVDTNRSRLTLRDVEMLKLLSVHTVMNSEHLYLLTPGTSEDSPFYTLSQGQKRCNARIRTLYDLHFINKASPRVPLGEGTSKQYVWLDRAGIKLLNSNRRPRSGLPQDYKHQSLILDLYCYFIQGQREGRWDILYLHKEQPAVTWNLIPDLTVLIRQQRKGLLFFFEVDRCEKKESDEKNKIQSYREWADSRLWVSEPWAKILPKPVFPEVVYLFDESQVWKRRATVLSKSAQKVGLKSDFQGMLNLEGVLETRLLPQ